MIHIRLRLFAVLRETAGTAEATLDLPDNARVATAVATVADRFPALRPHLGKAATAVNRSYVKPETVLSDGDELALLPPVSGG